MFKKLKKWIAIWVLRFAEKELGLIGTLETIRSKYHERSGIQLSFYSLKSEDEAADFILGITGRFPVHDRGPNHSWVSVESEPKGIKVICFYD